MSESTESQLIGVLSKYLEVKLLSLNLGVVKLCTPDKFPDQNEGICISLFRVSENANVGRQTSYGGDKIGNSSLNSTIIPPITLDLYYLITIFGQTEEKKYEILSLVLQLFHDLPVMNSSSDREHFPEILAETGNNGLYISLDELNINEMSNLWSMFKDVSYSISVSYKISPLRISSTKTTRPSQVLSREFIFSELEKGST